MSFEGPNNKKEKAIAPTETQEGALEQIPTKEAIIDMLSGSLEGMQLTESRALSDEKGLFLLEMQREGETPGEIVEYNYIRKGTHEVIGADGNPRKIFSSTNNIEATYFQDGMPVNGTTYATYDENTETWKVLGHDFPVFEK